MNSEKQSISNELTISLDWISFTFTEKMTVSEAIDLLGFSESDFISLAKGANGYKSQKKLSGHNIYVLYDGNDNMGIHVDVSGSGVPKLLEAYKETKLVETPFGDAYDLESETVISAFIRDICSVGHFTRLDFAIDDFGCKFYSLEELSKKLAKKLYVSKWRSYRELTDNGLYDKYGHTIYLGSAQSDIMLRIYDKRLEQNKGVDPNSNNYIQNAWIRWELQLRDDRANESANLLLHYKPIGEIALGILSYYFRLIRIDDSNRSRCSSEPKWVKFLNNIGKLRLSMRHSENSIERKKNWLEKQVAPTLALMLAHSGDVEYFNELAFRNMDRISSADKELLKTENPELYKQIFA